MILSKNIFDFFLQIDSITLDTDSDPDPNNTKILDPDPGFKSVALSHKKNLPLIRAANKGFGPIESGFDAEPLPAPNKMYKQLFPFTFLFICFKKEHTFLLQRK